MAGAVRAVRGALHVLKRVGAEPELAPASVVAGLALLPSVVAGLLVYRLAAVEMLAVALAAAAAAHAAARLLDQPLAQSPLLPVVVGVALVGSGASPAWAAVVAILAALLELVRVRFVPAAPVQAGLLAYALVLAASQGRLAAYVAPDGRPAPEPIRLWLQQGGHVAMDPVSLYVGSVPGPVFATSVLAVAIGAAWLWYSRRLSLLVVLTFTAGAMVPVTLLRWPAGYQLDSGPLWFAVALVLADRHTLPASPVGRPLMAFLAGALALGARTRGLAVESAPLAVAAAQALTAAAQGLLWVRDHRDETRARLRDLRDAIGALGRQNRPGAAPP